MTAKALTSNFFTNFKYKVKSSLRVMVVLLVLHICAAPLNLFNIIIFLSKSKKYGSASYNQLYFAIGIISTCIAVGAGLIIALNVFNYLYKKSLVDMTLSLPITTRQRFFSDFLAGAFIYLAPYIVSCVISLILNAIGSSLFAKWNYYDVKITSNLLTLIVSGFFIMLMLYILSILAITCCGSVFEAISYAGLLQILIPSTIAVFGYIFMGNLYGINLSPKIMPVIKATSPIGALIGMFSDMQYGGNILFNLKWLPPFAVLTVIYFAAAYVLYMKRKAEQVSKPFVYKLFYYIILTSITFCIGTIFTLESFDSNLIPLIIITAIVYLLFEVITNRGFKKFYMSAIRYAVTIAAVVGITLLFKQTDGFGAVTKIPSADSVASVETDYGGFFGIFDDNKTQTYSDSQTIEAIVKAHTSIIQRYEKEKNSGSSWDPYSNLSNVQITYNLKNGSSFSRTYSLHLEDAILLKSIDKTPEFKEKCLQTLKNDYKTYSEMSNEKEFLYLNNSLHNNPTPINSKYADELFEAIAEDISQIPESEYLAPSKDFIAFLEVGNIRIPLNENFSNTLLLFKKYNIKIPALDMTADLFNNKDFSLASPENLKVNLNGKNYWYSTINSYLYPEEGSMAYLENTPEARELITHAQPSFFTDEPCYSLYIYGERYIIPPKYSSLAEKIYNSAGQ